MPIGTSGESSESQMEPVVVTEWTREFIALESRNREAYLARDVEGLSRLWSEDLVVNSPINRVHHRRQVLDLLEAGVIAHSSYEVDIEVVERLGELVVIMGAERIVNAPGTPLIHRRFTNVWRQEAGQWRMFLRHANVTTP
jgi:ketosteroid isomerase-like protein